VKIENRLPSEGPEKRIASKKTEPNPDLSKQAPECSDDAGNSQEPDAASISALGTSVRASADAKVDELKKLYEEGRYSLDARKLAAKLIEHHESGDSQD
jgi:anti-sigma28 factor (negative regulator of flagellin synthesis)